MSGPLAGQVCLVTGATRGIGKGIALQLGEAGATVYITGRTLTPRPGKIGGSLQETAEEIRARGGVCVPVQCDHGNADEVEKLFERIKQEQDGHLDVLVNNAYAAVQAIFDSKSVKFWEQEPSMWDDVNNVGLRNHYFCTVYAARIMVPRKRGLIVNISSWGGLKYLFNVPYGVGKEALDRMAVDCGFELRKQNVACVSLWPGPVRTEIVDDATKGKEDSPTGKMFAQAETTEFAGKCIAAMAGDSNIMHKSGRIVTTADLADEFSLVDKDGSRPMNMRSFKTALQMTGHTWLATVLPAWFKFPFWVLALGGNKF